MKQVFFSASIVAMMSTGAIAGNIDTPTAASVNAIPPTVTDWSGGYVGLSYSSVDATMQYSISSTVYEYSKDSAIGVFAGYNWQSGNLVYGGELNATAGSTTIIGFPLESLDNTIELRARAGYATGDMLAYGFLGYSKSEYRETATPVAWPADGVTYGAGVDYMITNNIFAGLEFSHRELTGVATTISATQTHPIDMISLRIGYNY